MKKVLLEVRLLGLQRARTDTLNQFELYSEFYSRKWLENELELIDKDIMDVKIKLNEYDKRRHNK